MKLNDYQEMARSTAIYPANGTGRPFALAYVGLKLSGEAGEVSDKIGKALRDDDFGPRGQLTPKRRDELRKELGDVLWYVANAAVELGCTLEEVAQINLDKLAGRKARGTLQGSGDDR